MLSPVLVPQMCSGPAAGTVCMLSTVLMLPSVLVVRACIKLMVSAEECANATDTHEQAHQEVLPVCPEVIWS